MVRSAVRVSLELIVMWFSPLLLAHNDPAIESRSIVTEITFMVGE
jgi:hypothetical protein